MQYRWIGLGIGGISLGMAAWLALTESARAEPSRCPAGFRFSGEYADTRDGRKPVCIPSNRVRLWFKIFIADEHPGQPDYLNRTSNGISVIPAPPVPDPDVMIRVGSCFTTDQRSFSANPRASARVTIEMDILVEGGEIVRVGKVGKRDLVEVGETRNVDCATGQLIRSKRARNAGVQIIPYSRLVTVRGGVGDPFYLGLGPQAGANIDIEFRPETYDLKVTGTIGVFPSFEGYYSVDGGKVESLVLLPPEPWATARHLYDLGTGVNTRSFEGIIPLE